ANAGVWPHGIPWGQTPAFAPVDSFTRRTGAGICAGPQASRFVESVFPCAALAAASPASKPRKRRRLMQKRRFTALIAGLAASAALGLSMPASAQQYKDEYKLSTV